MLFFAWWRRNRLPEATCGRAESGRICANALSWEAADNAPTLCKPCIRHERWRPASFVFHEEFSTEISGEFRLSRKKHPCECNRMQILEILAGRSNFRSDETFSHLHCSSVSRVFQRVKGTRDVVSKVKLIFCEHLDGRKRINCRTCQD